MAAVAPAAIAGAAAANIVGSPNNLSAETQPMLRQGSNNGNVHPPVRGRRMCRRCQAFKPPRAHHCR
jgi:hypothetical protein